MRFLPILLLAAVSLSAKSIDFYSVPQEIALGHQMAVEVEKQAHVIDDPIVSEYVNRLGQKLANIAHPAFPVTVKMIESDEINAFTLPGGFVYVNSSMMKMADNEAQLASVIAHEIGHAAARHATRQASRNELGKMALIPLGAMAGWGGLAARQAAIAVAPMATMKYSREFETEADALGLDYLAQAGYDPEASIEMFERVASTEKKTPGRVSRLFLSHPPTGDRIRKTQAQIEKLRQQPGQDFVLNTSEFEDVRTRLMSGNAK